LGHCPSVRQSRSLRGHVRTDVCVPISRLAECITETQKDIAASFLPANIVGHAGDGNFHVGFMINPNEPKEMAEAERLNQRLVYRALSLDGTCTGEHGMEFTIELHKTRE